MGTDTKPTPEDTPCEKCDGEGWVWGRELDDNPDHVTDQRYDCDACRPTPEDTQGQRSGEPEDDEAQEKWLAELAAQCRCCEQCWSVPCEACCQGAPCDAICTCVDPWEGGDDDEDDQYDF